MKVLCVALAAGVLMPGLAAADYYRYETVGGTICFTDELNRVPLRYREEVKIIQEAALASYGRLTLVPRGATFAPSYDVWGPTLDEALTRSAERRPERRLWVDTGGGTAIDLPQGDSPIHVRKRGRWTRDGRMKSMTIVEQDGRERAVIENH
jgi:hypothetical protein